MFFYTLIVLSVLLHNSSSNIYRDPLHDYYIQTRYAENDKMYRLPHVPAKDLLYNLILTPSFTNEGEFTFIGQLNMHFKVDIENVTQLTMHSSGLKISSANIYADVEMSKLHDTVTVVFDPKTQKYEFVVFKWKKPLDPGKYYKLTIEYSGRVNDKMNGFYVSTYYQNGIKRFLGTTQFEPSFARKAFPCFDEPRYKARFQLNIECPITYECVSNTVAKSRVNNYITFAETPIMSTYLVAFLISNFERINVFKTGKMQFEIMARPDAKLLGDYIFDTGMQVLHTMGEYTGINYYTMNGEDHVMKITHSAIPDFEAGAMENWGALTYREIHILIDEKKSASISKISGSTEIAHEEAHQWFGNLVTCDWWSDAWLNEGFATFFQSKLISIVKPEFNIHDIAVVQGLQSVLILDSSEHIKSLSHEVYSPEDINENFNMITYSKGSAVIRMMEHLVGSEAFRLGLQYYLHDRAYKNALPSHLYSSLQKAMLEYKVDMLGFTIEEIMESWINQPGFPLITVSKKPESGKLIITQKRFFTRTSNAIADTLYKVPLSYTTETEANFENTRPRLFFSNESIEIDGDESYGWTILNLRQTGYYRVMYDEKLYAQIADTLQSDSIEKIHYVNRGQIVDDIFNFIREGRMKINFGLNILQFLKQELNSHVWDVARAGFTMLKRRFAHNQNLTLTINSHILDLMEETLKDLSLAAKPSDNLLRRVYRSNMLYFACELGHQNCLLKAKELYRELDGFDPDMRDIAYCAGLRYGNSTDFYKIWQMFLTENIVNVKISILMSLPCTRNKKNIIELLDEMFKQNSSIRAEEVMNLLNGIIQANVENTGTVLNYVENNTKKIKERLYSEQYLTVVKSLAMRLSKEQLNELQSFAERNSGVLSDNEKQVILNSINEARNDIKFTEEYLEGPLHSWLRDLEKIVIHNTADIVIYNFADTFEDNEMVQALNKTIEKHA